MEPFYQQLRQQTIILLLVYINSYGVCDGSQTEFVFGEYSNFPYSTCTAMDPMTMLGCSRSCSARTGCLGFATMMEIQGCLQVDPLATTLCNKLAVELSGDSENWVKFARKPGIESCVEYLVPRVPDVQMTASSTYEAWPLLDVKPYNARLYNNRTLTDGGLQTIGGWMMNTDDNFDRWIQVEFNNNMVIHGIATQGAWNDLENPSTYYDQRVTKYELLYSLNCFNWTTITDTSGHNKEFVGNMVIHEGNIVQTNILDIPVIAKCVRLHILAWDTAEPANHMLSVLRLDLLGCDYN